MFTKWLQKPSFVELFVRILEINNKFTVNINLNSSVCYNFFGLNE